MGCEAEGQGMGYLQLTVPSQTLKPSRLHLVREVLR